MRIVVLALVAGSLAGCQIRAISIEDEAKLGHRDAGNPPFTFQPGTGGTPGQITPSPDGSPPGTADAPLACTGTAEICNGRDDDCDGVVDNGFDLTRDTGNCGRCGNVCSFLHGEPICTSGVCALKDCLPGYYDVDGKPDNGCECLRTNGGVEICDGLDNDCNGQVDESFNLVGDLNNCGICNRVCEFAHAAASCAKGICEMGTCEPGRIDLNADSRDGCEYSCSPSVDRREVCDGVDNDCDGKIDNDTVDTNVPCGPLTSGVGECKRGATICTSGEVNCSGSGVPSMEICDGKDNDCNGQVDEGFDTQSDIRYCGNCKPCALPHAVPSCDKGACLIESCSPGYVDLDMKKDNGCEYACLFRGLEICNGIDDDCDGMVDEGIDKVTDSTNCGACGQVCRYSNAAAICASSACSMGACETHFYDLDGKSNNGCEYFCVATGVEICDGVDNDCNGLVDDGITKASDVNNCGACGRACAFTYATAQCNAGACAMGACQPGHYDLNLDPADGCEYACLPSNGGAEICDSKDNNCDGRIDEADPQIGKACYPQGVDGCDVVAGTCKGTCGFGQLACLGGALACQNAVTPHTDICDDLDNDCDGMADEDFDKINDSRYCGGCNSPCLYANAVPLCSNQVCSRGPCKSGWVDLDGLASNGCEYACTADGPEVCDGKDNDCNGKVDSNDPGLLFPATNFCLQTGECGKGGGTSPQYPGQGTFPVCTTAVGAAQPDWICNYPATVETTGPNQIAGQESWCDGLDNDCDGAVDEHTGGSLNTACFNSSEIGDCRRTGHVHCQADKTLPPACDFTGVATHVPQDEVCDGHDNDCDGLVDESWDNPPGLAACGGGDCRGVRDDLVQVTTAVTPYYIYRFEASRPDASVTSQGASEGRACSSAGILPWASVTYAQAQTACAAAGMRLCRTSRSGGCGQGAVQNDEWGFACQYSLACSAGSYPYACTYDSARCNGAENNLGVAAAAGAQATCSTSGDLDTTLAGNQQLMDMSGNVAEWTDDCRGSLSDGRLIYTIRGGAYDSYDQALRCDFMSTVLAQNFAHPDTGFRCCSSCPPGQAECGGSCVNLGTDGQHCGTCGTVCGGATTCHNGACR